TGGIGGAAFLRGVRRLPCEVTAITNTADDLTLHGLHISPDLDSVMYTLGGGADAERGWGRADETWTVSAELTDYDAEAQWFSLGDKDIATHLIRTRMLDAGYPLSVVTQALCARWEPGVSLLPMTDDRVETHVVVNDDGARALHFQEWWVRHRGEIPTERFVFTGAAQAEPAPGVLEAINSADAVILAPSNPVVSIAPILAVPGIRNALRQGPAPVVGVSPIIGGAPVRGMADRCLEVLGVNVSAAGVGEMYGARADEGFLDGWLVDDTDSDATVDQVAVRARPLWMTTPEHTQDIVTDALDLVGVKA
ncbi:MAG: 2-phospho-L-lactate transferase, partial [Stackebrandtia sp.]